MTPVNTQAFSPAPTAPLETKRSAHTAPRQGRPPKPESPHCDSPAQATGNPVGTEALKTMDAVNGAPSLAVSCIPSDLLQVPVFVDAFPVDRSR